MTKYGYITDSTYLVADTAITWDFVKYNEDESTTDFCWHRKHKLQLILTKL